MSTPRFLFRELVEMIEGDNRENCLNILDEYSTSFLNTPGSTHNHQNWRGGYWDHIVEVMNRAVFLYSINSRSFPFTLSSALLVLFLHDIEKPWKYELDLDGSFGPKKNFSTEEQSHNFRDAFINHWGITLTEEEKNALKYVHGEGLDYSSKRRVMGPLAAFCHICDVWVARIDYDCPMKDNDPWTGAGRIRKE